MKIAFGDLIACDYTIETPYQKPLGGSQSALCYLAEQLATQGHEVFLLNKTKTPGMYRGVTCLSVPLTNLDETKRRDLDAFVVLNLTGHGARIRSLIGDSTQLILWTGHTHHNRDMQPLRNPEECKVYDGFAFVSEWQRDRFCEEFAIPRDRTAVLKNAIAPAFAGLFPPNTAISPQKSRPPAIAYTSTPFRGLDLLLDIFPRIRQAIPGTRLKVFSSMKVYHISDAADQENYGHLYRQCQETEGVEYVGAIPQTKLAQELQKITVLAYPNTYLETSCIAVMEAMASGCHIVTSDLGALAETTAGFARLIPVAGNAEIYKNEFTQAVIEVLQQVDELPIRQMVDYIDRGCSWSVRSLEWLEWLQSIGERAEGRRQKAEENLDRSIELSKPIIIYEPNVSPIQGQITESKQISIKLKPEGKMNIAFLDFSNWDYQVESPYKMPLGGSESALCYLAEALAKLGHQVFLLNKTSRPTQSRGVNCLSWREVFAPNSPYQSVVKSLDVVIVLNQAGEGIPLRKLLEKKTRLVLWTQQVPTLPVMEPLQNKNEQATYDGIAFVSNWQRDRFLTAFGIAPEKTRVLRNAIAPAFAQQFEPGDRILTHKSKPPILAYTSTPFRGLDLLVDLFPKIRQAYPGTRLKVFSSKKVYQLSQSVDESEYGSLYRKCREMDGVDYMGSISQPELAQELRSVSVLAYANTFEETSCIAVMEAMASGCHVVTSNLAALPETTAGYGQLVSVADVRGFSDVRDWRFSQRSDWKAYGDRFVRASLDVLHNYYLQENSLREMVDYINDSCTWDVRSHEWVDWLQELVAADRNPPLTLPTPNPSQEGNWRGIETDGAADELPQANRQLYVQAEMYYQRGNLASAISYYQTAIKLRPDLVGVYWNLAKLLESQGQEEAAKEYRHKALQLHPSLSNYTMN